tara:strand:+ start:9784 stop:10665 length:882 start_codon:yes stop_codon:yes gene_type:complete
MPMNGLNFVALDVETANEDHSSICQIGLARFIDGKLVDELMTLIDPLQEFSQANIDIHGIGPRQVSGKQTLVDFIEDFWAFIGSDVLVTHTAYDRTAITKATGYYRLKQVNNVQWLDSARVTRRAWTQFSDRGYGLANICKHLGIHFDHHDALEDAIACGKVFVEACKKTNWSVSDWQSELSKSNYQLSKFEQLKVEALKGDPTGELAGNIIVFTGNLTLSRADAAELAAKAGCDVGKGVTKKTTMLVVGDQDLSVLAGHEKSSKHRKAEDLIEKGQNIKILKESDFMKLVSP